MFFPFETKKTKYFFSQKRILEIIKTKSNFFFWKLGNNFLEFLIKTLKKN
jgi:hypothetical protein